jgi:histidine triad (HIT) family protein
MDCPECYVGVLESRPTAHWPSRLICNLCGKIRLGREGLAEVKTCVFCAIACGDAPAEIVREWSDAVAIVPLNPVVPGHVIVMPKSHVTDALDSPVTTAAVMARVAQLAAGPCNIITSVGREATQTVFHLHVHIVPRADGDGLTLPWTAQQKPTPPANVTFTKFGEVPK